ncbi:hypothetical protein [Devosia sp. A449]
MSGSFGIESGQIVVRKDGRTVLTTGNSLVQFLTSEQTFAANAVFPDVPKGEIYMLQWNILYSASKWNYLFNNASCVGARPQEWTNSIVLGPVPAGADTFIGRVRLNRTVSPTHSWANEALVPRVTQNEFVQLTGSILLEQVRGFCRSLSVYISGGNLIVDMQQSCGPISGNFVTWGNFIEGGNSLGGENSVPSGAGKYVHTAHAGFTATGITDNWTTSNPFIDSVVGTYTKMRNGGSSEAPYSDPTNYGSTYAITVQGRFGRRS